LILVQDIQQTQGKVTTVFFDDVYFGAYLLPDGWLPSTLTTGDAVNWDTTVITKADNTKFVDTNVVTATANDRGTVRTITANAKVVSQRTSLLVQAKASGIPNPVAPQSRAMPGAIHQQPIPFSATTWDGFALSVWVHNAEEFRPALVAVDLSFYDEADQWIGGLTFWLERTNAEGVLRPIPIEPVGWQQLRWMFDVRQNKSNPSYAFLNVATKVRVSPRLWMDYSLLGYPPGTMVGLYFNDLFFGGLKIAGSP
jgi:hypothetical protein